MGILTFGDISISDAQYRLGPKGVDGRSDFKTVNQNNLTGNEKYDHNTYKYPLDVGATHTGHYVMININMQERTQFNLNPGSDLPTIVQNRKDFGYSWTGSNLGEIAKGLSGAGTSALNTETGKSVTGYASSALNGLMSSDLSKDIKNNTPDSVKTALSTTGSVLSGSMSSLGAAASDAFYNMTRIQSVRTIRRTTDTIALYMPSTVNFINQQNYSDLTLGSNPISAAAAAGASAVKSVQSGKTAKDLGAAIAANLSPYLAGYALNKLGPLGQAAFTAALGVVENPMLELLYISPSFRTFQLDFMFYPRSKQEAEQVYLLLGRLQFHQAPEVHKQFNGYYLVPPSEFDVSFYYNGKENPNIPKLSTCVLEQIIIDYAPHGWTTYEVPGEMEPLPGGTGFPVAIRATLMFKETEIMTKDNFQIFQSSLEGPKNDNSAVVFPVMNQRNTMVSELPKIYHPNDATVDETTKVDPPTTTEFPTS